MSGLTDDEMRVLMTTVQPDTILILRPGPNRNVVGSGP